VAVLFSIAACQILLALALVALLLSNATLRLPRIWLPLGLFLLVTLVSLACSGHIAEGLPQVRKIYVYSMLLVVFSLFRDVRRIRWLVLCWAGVGAVVAARGAVQFADKFSEAEALGKDFLKYYEPERITGFMSHWMTFGGQEMFVLLMLAAFLFWSPAAQKRGLWFGLFCLAALSTALLLGWTRSIWIATTFEGLYLLLFWNRRLAAVVPVALLAAFLIAPAFVRTRVNSIFHSRENQFRLLVWSTGVRMIEAHPLLGLGPEQVNMYKNPHFKEYFPPGATWPLPDGSYVHLHNVYLQYAAERGIPALLILIWMLLTMLTDFWKALRRLPPGRDDRRFILHGAIAVILATMIAGLFEHNLGDSEVLTMSLIVAGCGYVATEEKEQAVA